MLLWDGGGASGSVKYDSWHAMVWTTWTYRNDIIFVGGSSSIENLVDRVKLSSRKWFLGKNLGAPTPSTSGRCNLSYAGPARRG
jgi:hypothetical protein